MRYKEIARRKKRPLLSASDICILRDDCLRSFQFDPEVDHTGNQLPPPGNYTKRRASFIFHLLYVP
jgi:hypothetical protein